MSQSSVTAPRPDGNETGLLCPNLRQLAGDTYRITWECPLDQRPTPTIKADPWCAMVPTYTGHLFPWGVDKLGVWVEGRRRAMVEKLAAIGCTVRTVGTDSATLLCAVELFDQVAKITRARKRRKLSPERRAAAVERLAGYAFKPARQSDFEGPVCPPAGPDDLGVVLAEADERPAAEANGHD